LYFAAEAAMERCSPTRMQNMINVGFITKRIKYNNKV
jgi:hypothetical protein